MAGNPPAFQLYADDFLGGTCDMTQAEVGAYFLLLLYQWNNESIPADAKRQRLIAKGSVSSRVIEKFPASEDGLLRNERMEIERQKQIEYRNGQSDSGKRGAAKRWGRHSDPNVVAIVSPITPPSNRQWRKDSSPVSSLQSPNNIPPSPREGFAFGGGLIFMGDFRILGILKIPSRICRIALCQISILAKPFPAPKQS